MLYHKNNDLEGGQHDEMSSWGESCLLSPGVYILPFTTPQGGGKKKLIYKKREKKKLEIYALWRELAYLEIKTLFVVSKY